MDPDVTVSDVARMAVAMEEKGMKFYTWAAGNFPDREVRDMFLRLAEEEKDHVRLFRKILEMPGAAEKLTPEVGKYLKMLADSAGIFPHHRDITPETVKNPLDALAMGIQAEKDSILFYQELYNRTDSLEVKETLSKLLQEEKLHLIELRESMYELAAR